MTAEAGFVTLPVCRRRAAGRALRRAGGWAVRLALLVWFVFAAIVFGLRYWVLPDVDRYRPDLERLATNSLGLGVSIGGMTGGWDGLRPELFLTDVRIANRQGATVLAFASVETVLSWQSLALLQPRLHRLAIEAPVLHVQREADGRILVAGIAIDEATTDTTLADWVLNQHEIVVRDAILIWEDIRRGAPPLFLERLNLRLENSGRRHRFGLNGRPSAELASRLDVRADLRGEGFGDLSAWSGRFYAETDAVDLAGWQTWFDYPFDLPQGHGGMRLWLDIDGGKPVDLTADVALRDIRLRLASQLPELDLEEMQGRLSAHQPRAGKNGRTMTIAAHQLTLLTRGGTRVEPTDFQVDWSRQEDGSVRGQASANVVDLEVLASLAATLPLSERTRSVLAEYAPQGRLADLKTSWHGTTVVAQEYSIKARFEGLGARARGTFPGFSGLSGGLDFDQKGGRLVLRSGPSTLALPAVFAEPVIAFDALAATARWQVNAGVLDVNLEQASFSGPDAIGSGQGTYRLPLAGAGAGQIDLKARLEQADGRAVWRYMPHVVAAEARSWLKRGITAGTASDVQLTLRGDLDKFPFRHKDEGKFLVTAKVRDAVVDYADGWPRIDGIAGDLRFEGAGMFITAHQGSILGARLAATTANIADLDAKDQRLEVKGTVNGPTAEFLRFVEASPVGERIGHFAADMQASGNGRLDLVLSIPLAHVEDTWVKGDFQFIGNQIVVAAALPPVTQVNGQLLFTANDISARDLTGNAFGAPLRIGIRTQGENVAVSVQGAASIAALRQQFETPLFDHLSGSAPWRAEVKVRKRQAEIVVESTLQGVSSSLPEPFNKTATDPLPLRVERTDLPAETNRRTASREQWRMSFGRLVTAQVIRRVDGGQAEIEQAALAIGEPLRLPERGVAVMATVARADLDLWRQVLSAATGRDGAAAGPMPQVSLRARELRAFGRDWSDVSLRWAPIADGVQGHVESRQVSGDWTWQQAGKGRLRARLTQLAVPAHSQVDPRSEVAEVLDALPGLDIVADEFSLGAHSLGRLEMEATNEARLWRINRLLITNPDGELTGRGRWRFTGGDRTGLDFKLDAKDVGKLLGRFGYADAVRRGTATLEGRIGWFGVPTSIDYASFSGEMRLAAEKGQFAKLEPGIGKLLSLLSLQTLPRRITLDFRDVFSEGFAFDNITGRFEINNGRMQTDDLKIVGPSAKVLMRGDIDLRNETQNLRVAIQPEVGGTVALGAAVINPVAGLAALLAQKILQDPLNKAFAFEYAITGAWADPKVEKLAQPVPPAAVEEIPNEPAR